MPAALLHRGLEGAAQRFGDRDALRAGEERWSFRDLDALANGLAQGLGARAVGVGDRVAVMTANRVEFVLAVTAISKVGASSVLLNPAWKSAEVTHALALTGPRWAVTDSAGVAVLGPSFPPEHLLDVDDPAVRAELVPRAAPTPPDADGASEAVLIFSSGTTGLPKAVRHTHATLSRATAQWCAALGLGPEDRFQVATPPSHILGLLNLLAAAEAGALVRLHRRFDLDEVLRCVAADRTTLEMAVAPIALALANHPALEDFDLSSLRYIMWGATPVSEEVARRVTARSGVRWLPAYGASEVPVITANPVDRPEDWRLDSAGLPAPGVELRVVDLDSGAALGAGSSGEVQVRSAATMIGYLPEDADREAFVDGWYRTGDVGWLEPAGWLHLTDRWKEMIKVRGFQVAPAEIEAVLLGHPGVQDCAVFGVPDADAGEVPVAAVRVDPDHPPSEEELSALVGQALATYKRLRHVVVVEEIPRLPSGKVLRRTLRDQWAPVLAGAG